MERKRKKSIGRKMITILAVLGLLTALMCVLNVMAYSVLNGYNKSLEEKIAILEAQVEATAENTETTEQIDYLMERIDIKIEGTYIFDIFLVIVALVITAVAIFISLWLIVFPTKRVSKKLEELIASVKQGGRRPYAQSGCEDQ